MKQQINWRKALQALADKGITQADIAAACDCAQPSVSELARGVTRNPSLATGLRLFAFAALHGVSIEDEAPIKAKRALPSAPNKRTQRSPKAAL